MIFEDQKKKNIMVIIVLIMPPRGHLKNAWFFVLWNSWGHFVTCSLTCFLVNSSLKLVIGTEHTHTKKNWNELNFSRHHLKKKGCWFYIGSHIPPSLIIWHRDVNILLFNRKIKTFLLGKYVVHWGVIRMKIKSTKTFNFLCHFFFRDYFE